MNSAGRLVWGGSEGSPSSDASGSTARSGCSHLVRGGEGREGGGEGREGGGEGRGGEGGGEGRGGEGRGGEGRGGEGRCMRALLDL